MNGILCNVRGILFTIVWVYLNFYDFFCKCVTYFLYFCLIKLHLDSGEGINVCAGHNRFLILPGIFVCRFDKKTFPKVLAFISHIHTTMPPTRNFPCLYCHNLVISSELEKFVKCLLFCYFTFLFCFYLFAAQVSRLAFSFIYCTVLNSIWFTSFSLNSNIPNGSLLFSV